MLGAPRGATRCSQVFFLFFIFRSVFELSLVDRGGLFGGGCLLIPMHDIGKSIMTCKRTLLLIRHDRCLLGTTAASESLIISPERKLSEFKN